MAADTDYIPILLEYPDLMLLEQCRQLFFCITNNGVKLELSDFTRFIR